MKYYAVTDDPTELMHFGIKGMHWGVRRTDAQLGHPKTPRSAAYKRASNKLGKMMKSGIEKAKANWKEYNSPQNKYNRQTNRAIEKARKGKLKYGKLSDDQVRRITERLNLERQARQLSETEKTWKSKLGQSISEGIISGVGSGFGRRTSEWISRGSVLKTDRLRAEQNEAFEKRRDKRRIESARREAQEKIEREFAQKKREDQYEYERDRERENERVRNLYEYGAAYDKDGKLDYTDRDRLENYYENRFISGESRTDSYHRQYKESASHRKEEERRRRMENTRHEREMSKLEAENKKAEERRQREADARERERYRRGIEQLSREASKRDAERAWNDRFSRISAQSSTPVTRITNPRTPKINGSNKRNRKRGGR